MLEQQVLQKCALFQDSNTVQVRMVKHLQDHRGNLTVVGDDAQSIYGWRGATNRAFTLLKEMLSDQCRDFKLVTNYRSLPQIVQVQNLLA
jgi:DNA helicase II / ATP-dependent DNA helicase PcrA